MNTTSSAVDRPINRTLINTPRDLMAMSDLECKWASVGKTYKLSFSFKDGEERTTITPQFKIFPHRTFLDEMGDKQLVEVNEEQYADWASFFELIGNSRPDSMGEKDFYMPMAVREGKNCICLVPPVKGRLDHSEMSVSLYAWAMDEKCGAKLAAKKGGSATCLGKKRKAPPAKKVE